MVVMRAASVVLILFGLAAELLTADKLNCYFPIEYQGVYLTQSNPRPRDNKVQYTEIVVHSDEIPTWGRCYRKRGTMVVLHNLLPQGNCFRCIHLYRRSPNVLQIYSEGLDKCYQDEDVARLSCSTDHTIWSRRVEEITLYRTKQYGQQGEGSIEAIYCPFNGHFRYLYSLQIPGEEPLECSKPTSEMNNCPYGFGLNFIFQHCTFGHMEWTYQCLGDWKGPNGERFAAFLDTDAIQDDRPKYRCGRYREEAGTGKVYLALSSDSTCQNNLASATQGHEILKLISVPGPPWPQQVQKSTCKFPPWLQGYWKDLYVDNNTIVYKDNNMYKTFTAKCIERKPGTEQEKYIIYTRSQCQEQYFTCIWVKKRSDNVIEYQLALNPSKEYKDDICDPNNFIDKKWDTQGKLSQVKMTSCPISGEYTGQIPDAEGLCTRMFSDCDHPEIMYYTVSSCTPNPEIYEDRVYRCLGYWNELDVIYSFVHRLDIEGFECLVGTILDNGEEVLIKEAGSTCQRDRDPYFRGMRLSRIGSCPPSKSNSVTANRQPHSPRPAWTITTRDKSTKPWRPITASPSGRTNSAPTGSVPKVPLLMLMAYHLALISRG